MRITETSLPGCLLIEASPHRDDRGYFVRMFDALAFAEHGMNVTLAEASLSYNRARGTLRGLHFQSHPRMEEKIVRCARGAIFDVAVDIRPGSPSFGRWYGTELSDENLRQLYIPAGFAHGFQTLCDETTVAYHISVPYEAGLAAGLRYDDPAIGVTWPLPPALLSKRDLALPTLAALDHATLMPFGTSPP